jgi:predicted nucleotidyltransferase component of viral defense system
LIPEDFISEWKNFAPWRETYQVEQDLIICRALVEIFSHPLLAENLAFRGGTALFKLHLAPERYSEDIDLVQVHAGPIGPVMHAIQEKLNSWLGTPKRSRSEGRVTLIYRLVSEEEVPLKLKIEINTREHFTVEGYQKQPFAVGSRWFNGNCEITTYTLEELLATKLRALYQRRKGRDLFDLWLGLTEAKADAERIVHIFKHYMENEGQTVDGMNYEKNLQEKMIHRGFLTDLNPLLPADTTYDIEMAFRRIRNDLLRKIDDKLK